MQPSESSPSSPPPLRFPMSAGQRQLWFMEQMQPGAYNYPVALRLHGPLEEAALERSLNDLIARHETLRTALLVENDQFVQTIYPPHPISFGRVDLRGVPEPTAPLQSAIMAETQQPFDLHHVPLLRSVLFRLDRHDHVLLLILHHTLFDGASEGVLLRDLAALYESHLTGNAPTLPILPIQYADYAAWQAEQLTQGAADSQLPYWQRELADLPAALNLPTDRSRPADLSGCGRTLRFSLPADLTIPLQELGHAERATLFMVLLAAFDVLLFRCTGQTDLVLGSTFANRPRRETENLIGYLVNTVVLRAKLNGAMSYRDLLRQIWEKVLDAHSHQDLPFNDLVAALSPERSTERSPLFQAMCVHEQIAPGIEAGGLSFAVQRVESGTSKFDLTLFIEESHTGVVCAWEYSTDLFEAATIRRLHEHYQILLESLVAQPDIPIAQLPLLSQNEQHQLLVEWNDTARPFPDGTPVHHLFEAQVERTPEAIAVIAGTDRLTYRELDAHANQLARHLRQCGVGLESLVGLCMDRSVAMLIGLLAVLKAGGAYVPLDPSYPAARLDYMIRDSGAQLILTQAALQDRLPAEIAALCLDQASPMWANESPENLESDLDTNHLAYVIYTSGSTGQPKGAMISHRSLVNYVVWATQEYHTDGGTGAPVHSSLSFDLTLTGLWCPLLAGQPVMLVPDSPIALGEILMQSGNYSLVKITPAHLDLLNAQIPADQLAGRVRCLVIGGSQLMAATIRHWQQHAPHTRLINEYGPTETVVGCCIYDTPLDFDGSAALPIGRPIANVQLYVLDSAFEPVPIGVVGELYIGGVGLARGYLNRPALTAEKFVPNPFGTPGSRLYRTGDLARWRPDGVLEYIGRIDEQIKVRGYRIEPGEIEACLRQHPAVRDAAIVPRPDSSGEMRLIAYIVPQHTPPHERDLREWLSAVLPAYMIPAVYITLDSLPLTPNGKLDLKALPALGHPAPESDSPPHGEIETALAHLWEPLLGVTGIRRSDNFFARGGHSLLAARLAARIQAQFQVDLPLRAIFEQPTLAGLASRIEQASRTAESPRLDRSARADPLPTELRMADPVPLDPAPLTDDSAPRGEIEMALAQLWEQLLGVSPIRREDHFFERGGHSLLATRLSARIREQFRVDLPLRIIFEQPTLAALAQQIAQAEAAPELPPLEHAARAERLPLSFQQQRIWFLDQFAEGRSSAYNVTLVLELRGDLDINTLQASLTVLAHRHESLRTSFVNLSGEPYQQIAVQIALPFALGTTEDIEQVAAQPFALEGGLLWRAHLLTANEPADPAIHILLLVFHHTIIDGPSLTVFLNELAESYTALHAEGTPSFAPLVVDYADYALWQRRWLDSERLTALLNYWRRELGGELPASALPTDYPRPPIRSGQGAMLRSDLPDTLAVQALALARQENATPFMLLLTAFAALLYRLSGQDNLVIGTPVANRVLPETEPLIGLFTNTLALRLDLRGELSFRALLARVREICLGAYTHQQMPFEKLVEALRPPRDLSRTPIFQVMFAYQQALAEQSAGDLVFRPLSLDDHTAKFDLTLFVDEHTDALSLAWEYSTDLFESSTIEQMQRHFLTLLETALAAPDIPVSQLLADLLPTPTSAAPSVPTSPHIAAPLPTHDGLEYQLVQMWESLLERSHIHVTDNFFDLGGHSLLAIQLLTRIKEQFGKTLPLTALFQAATAQQLAALLRESDQAQAWSPLVEIQRSTDNTSPPLFLIHPSGGTVLCYVPLAQHLGMDQAVYGLQAPLEYEDTASRYTTIEGMAAGYLEAMQQHTPHGPYTLAGWSLGGVIAYEMAQQLHRQDEQVALLALLDTLEPTLVQAIDPIYDSARFLSRFARGLNLPIEESDLIGLTEAAQVQRVLEHLQTLEQTIPETALLQDPRYLIVDRLHMQALHAYRPQPYRGKITLLRTEQAIDARYAEVYGDPALGWQRWATQPIEIHRLPGNHQSFMREPLVKTLADRLRACLDTAQA